MGIRYWAVCCWILPTSTGDLWHFRGCPDPQEAHVGDTGRPQGAPCRSEPNPAAPGTARRCPPGRASPYSTCPAENLCPSSKTALGKARPRVSWGDWGSPEGSGSPDSSFIDSEIWGLTKVQGGDSAGVPGRGREARGGGGAESTWQDGEREEDPTSRDAEQVGAGLPGASGLDSGPSGSPVLWVGVSSQPTGCTDRPTPSAP